MSSRLPPDQPEEVSMIDHLGLRTRQYDALLAFYEAALAPLGYTKLFVYDGGRNSVATVWPRCGWRASHSGR